MTQEERLYFRWLKGTMNEYRGKVLSISIYIEHTLVEIMNLYFIGDDWLKLRHFNELIVEGLTFDKKIKIFTKLIKGNLLPEELDIPLDYIKEIDRLRILRNKFAHLQIDGRVEKIAERIEVRDRLNLLSYKDYNYHEEEVILHDLNVELHEFEELSNELIKISNRYHEIIDIKYPEVKKIDG